MHSFQFRGSSVYADIMISWGTLVTEKVNQPIIKNINAYSPNSGKIFKNLKQNLTNIPHLFTNIIGNS
jgi:accessory colonization factor AcfC